MLWLPQPVFAPTHPQNRRPTPIVQKQFNITNNKHTCIQYIAYTYYYTVPLQLLLLYMTATTDDNARTPRVKEVEE